MKWKKDGSIFLPVSVGAGYVSKFNTISEDIDVSVCDPDATTITGRVIDDQYCEDDYDYAGGEYIDADWCDEYVDNDEDCYLSTGETVFEKSLPYAQCVEIHECPTFDDSLVVLDTGDEIEDFKQAAYIFGCALRQGIAHSIRFRFDIDGIGMQFEEGGYGNFNIIDKYYKLYIFSFLYDKERNLLLAVNFSQEWWDWKPISSNKILFFSCSKLESSMGISNPTFRELAAQFGILCECDPCHDFQYTLGIDLEFSWGYYSRIDNILYIKVTVPPEQWFDVEGDLFVEKYNDCIKDIKPIENYDNATLEGGHFYGYGSPPSYLNDDFVKRFSWKFYNGGEDMVVDNRLIDIKYYELNGLNYINDISDVLYRDRVLCLDNGALYPSSFSCEIKNLPFVRKKIRNIVMPYDYFITQDCAADLCKYITIDQYKQSLSGMGVRDLQSGHLGSTWFSGYEWYNDPIFCYKYVDLKISLNTLYNYLWNEPKIVELLHNTDYTKSIRKDGVGFYYDALYGMMKIVKYVFDYFKAIDIEWQYFDNVTSGDISVGSVSYVGDNTWSVNMVDGYKLLNSSHQEITEFSNRASDYDWAAYGLPLATYVATEDRKSGSIVNSAYFIGTTIYANMQYVNHPDSPTDTTIIKLDDATAKAYAFAIFDYYSFFGSTASHKGLVLEPNGNLIMGTTNNNLALAESYIEWGGTLISTKIHCWTIANSSIYIEFNPDFVWDSSDENNFDGMLEVQYNEPFMTGNSTPPSPPEITDTTDYSGGYVDYDVDGATTDEDGNIVEGSLTYNAYTTDAGGNETPTVINSVSVNGFKINTVNKDKWMTCGTTHAKWSGATVGFKNMPPYLPIAVQIGDSNIINVTEAT